MTKFETIRLDMGTHHKRVAGRASTLAFLATRKTGGPYVLVGPGGPGPQRSKADSLLRLRELMGKDEFTRVDWHPDSGPQFRVRKQADYLNPLRDCIGLAPGRVDMGVDYSVTADSPIYAIGDGIVTVYRTTSGWPGGGGNPGAYIAYKLTSGPRAGSYVYFAENITLAPHLGVGSLVNSDTRIATLHPAFANCETGWASASSVGYSPVAAPCYSEGDRTASGESFNAFMQSLGAPAGLAEGRPITNC